MAVTFDSSGCSIELSDGGNQLSYTHSIGSTANILIVGFLQDGETGVITPTITLSGSSMSHIATIFLTDSSAASFWYMISPPAGNNVVEAIFDYTTNNCVLSGISYSGVDINAPFSESTGTSNTAISTSIDASTPTGGALVGFMGIEGFFSYWVITGSYPDGSPLIESTNIQASISPWRTPTGITSRRDSSLTGWCAGWWDYFGTTRPLSFPFSYGDSGYAPYSSKTYVSYYWKLNPTVIIPPHIQSIGQYTFNSYIRAVEGFNVFVESFNQILITEGYSANIIVNPIEIIARGSYVEPEVVLNTYSGSTLSQLDTYTLSEISSGTG